MSERTLVIWLPDWPVTALQRAQAAAGHDTADPDAPIALFSANRVVACSPSARREGVRRGMRRREAQARCPELTVVKHDEQLDHREFAPIVDRLEAATPGVQILRPGMLAVRMRGPARYYGGEQPAALGLLGVLAEQGVDDARAGVADGPFAAEHAARAAAPVLVVPADAAATFLAPLPVSVLEHDELPGLLVRLGVRTLGEFAALPADEVRGRFGEAGARLHALCGGVDARRVTPRQAPPEYERSVDFEPPLELVDQIAFALRQLASDFIDGLTAAQLVCTSLGVEAVSERGERSERVWLHPRSFTPAEVIDRVRWQLQANTALQASGSKSGLRSGIARVRLVPETVDDLAHHEQGLWGSGPDERVHHALSRVQGMLGHEGVVTAAVGGGRTLAERQLLVPWGDRAVAARAAAQPWPGHLPPPLPATVFPAPLPAEVADDSGAPVAVDDRDRLSAPPSVFSISSGGQPTGRRRVAHWAGPWSIRERWWDPAAARVVHRFQVVDADGVAWLLALQGGGWRAEARYD